MRLSTGGLIATLFVGQILGMSGFVSFPALLPEFRRLWSLSASEAGLVSGIYFAGYLLAVSVLSGLTDRFPARRIYLGSQLFSVIAALGFAFFAHGLVTAAAWRFLQGVGFGGTHMPGLRALSDAVPLRRQGRAVAVFTATFTVGSSLSFASSGALAGLFGWRLGFALLALGPLAGAIIGALVLPATANRVAPAGGLRWLPDLRPLLRNRAALRFSAAYALHNAESSIMRAWIVTLLVFAAGHAGVPQLGGYATTVATLANLIGLPLIVLTNEIATRHDRQAVIAATITISALIGVVLAIAGILSPVAAIVIAIVYGGAATADSGTINAGLVAVTEPERRGAFLALHALAGFGGAAVAPILFGVVLDFGGGAGSGRAWIIAFAITAAVNASWPLAYRARRRRVVAAASR